MKNRLLAVFFSVIVVFMVFTFVVKIEEMGNHTSAPKVYQGILDLSKIDLNDQGTIKLDGEWEFYDSQLINSEDIESGRYAKDKHYVNVPGKWNKYELDRNNPEAFGYGTFHLRILLGNDTESLYGLKTTNIGMSNQIWVNGEAIGESGFPGSTKESYQMGNVPYTSYFQVDNNTIDLIVWVANYDYTPFSGIVNSIFFGTQKDIQSFSERQALSDVIIITIFVFMGMVFLVLFLFMRKAYCLMSFSGLCFIAATFILNHSEKLQYRIIPNLDYGIFARLQYLTPGVLILLALVYFYNSYRSIFSAKVTVALVVVAVALIPVCFVAPLRVQSVWSSYQTIFILVMLFYFVFMSLYGVIQKKEGSLFSLIEAISFLAMGIIAANNIFTAALFASLLFVQLVFMFTHSLLIATRLKGTFTHLEKISNELIEMDKRKDEFLAKTSHEFKTPLHGIINITKVFLAQEEKHLTRDQMQNLSLVIDIANRLSGLVNDILDMAKIKEGKLAINEETINVNEVLRDMKEVCQYIYEDRKSEIIFEALDELPPIRADKDRLKQIMYNLIDNAMVHTLKGKVIITAQKKADVLEIAVQDHGLGIPQDKLDTIFEPFAQLSEMVSNNRSGAGLGLSIVKQLTELMKGTLKLESIVGAGTCVTLGFPISECMEVDVVVNENRNSESIREKFFDYNFVTPLITNPAGENTIIVADDNFSNLKVLIDVLATDQYKIVAVKNGQEVLEQVLQNQNTVLVILDVMMPDMSGYEVCQLIRKNYNPAELPVLMITAAVNAQDVIGALKSGANDFLNKPFRIEELKARVDTLIEMKKAANQKTSYEIAFLHAQIKPHFLYNALNTIAACCETDPLEAGDLIISLSKYLRGTLDFGNLDSLVSVDKELNLVKAYLNIEKARFEGLEVVYDLDDDIDIQIPPMTLQILTENAVKHGIMKKDGFGSVSISIKRIDEGIHFMVEDDGLGMTLDMVEDILKTPQKEGSIGLYNVHQRLVRLFGNGLMFSRLVDKGTQVSFVIPYGRKH